MDGSSAEFCGRFGALLRQYRRGCGLRQLDLATALPVDHTIISRWEGGVLFPTLGQLHTLAKALQLKGDEFESLYYSWKREAESVPIDFLPYSHRPDILIGSIETSINCARHLRKSGQPRMAMVLCERDVLQTLDRVRSIAWSSVHTEVLVKLSELLVEQCKAGLDFLPRKHVRSGALALALKNMQRIHNACQTELTMFFLELATEGSTYVGGDVSAAFVQSMTLLDNERQIPDAWRPELLRAAAINAGKIGNKDALKEVEHKIEDLLNKPVSSMADGEHAFVLEGLARGWSLLDPCKGTEVVDRAWNLRRSSTSAENNSKLRHVQLVRTEAEISAAYLEGADKVEIVRKIRTAIVTSKEQGYDRYLDQLQSLLCTFE